MVLIFRLLASDSLEFNIASTITFGFDQLIDAGQV
jgi:hypothetical protein